MEIGFPSEADESVPTVVQGVEDIMGGRSAHCWL